jgi:hypothetical protein
MAVTSIHHTIVSFGRIGSFKCFSLWCTQTSDKHAVNPIEAKWQRKEKDRCEWIGWYPNADVHRGMEGGEKMPSAEGLGGRGGVQRGGWRVQRRVQRRVCSGEFSGERAVESAAERV